MDVTVSVRVVSPRILAAVRRKVALGSVGVVCRPALGTTIVYLLR